MSPYYGIMQFMRKQERISNVVLRNPKLIVIIFSEKKNESKK